MEDQIVEWRIVEHTSLEEEGEEEEEEGEVKESRVRWLVNKGLWFGKKVIITGFVISSAPVVLPPLFVISALGFAFSVPFGLAFAGYTCTEKLMNTLLPRSEPPLLLEYGVDEEYDEQLEGKGSGFGGEMVMEEEEKKQMEDVKEGVEMRIQLVMDENRGYGEDQDLGRVEEEREINIDEGSKEEGYEEDVGEYLEGENEGPMKDMNLEVERGRGEENWEIDGKIKRTEGLDLVAIEARGENEGEKDLTLTPGLPDRNLVEVYVDDDAAAKEDSRPRGLGGEEDGKDTSPEVVEKPLESKAEKAVSLVIDTETKPETGMEVTTAESIEVTKKPNSSKSSKKHHKKKKGNEEKNASVSEEGEELSKKQQGDIGVKATEMKDEARDEGTVKQDEKHLSVKRETKGTSDEVNQSGATVTQDEKHLPVKRETKESRDEVNQSGATKKAKKATETQPGGRDARHGRDVGVAAKPSKDHNVISNGKTAAKDTSGPLEDKDTIVVEKEAQVTAPDVRGDHSSERKRTTDQKKNVNDSSVKEISGRSGITVAKRSKEFFSEEKIWEKINAMRTIVGYAAAPQSVLIEELKALYIFTGVEPPSPFVVSSDLAEVNNKLHFLMSIVGIK